MARKNGNNNQTSIGGTVYTKAIENIMPQSMLPYAEFVILDRALPRVEDGLKPVQRRILYTMNEMGLLPDKPHKKSARVVGDCMGKYHPHGDSSVYDAMVRMAQPFNMRLTLVDGHGNFGSVDGDPAAAMRYTEVRMAPLALELLRDLDKETVPFSFNFDDSLLEPDLIPGRFPNLLVNGANGIAVGLATNIPTHNLTEAINGCCAYIDNNAISLDEMMKIIPGPDFSTGGYIIANELRQAYATGKGRITLRAKFSVENGERGGKNIVITELPYQTNKADLLRKIALLKEDKKDALLGITDIVDESDRVGTRAVIYCKKEANVSQILQMLFKYTDLECTFGINMVAIAGGKPQQLGLIDIIKYYTSYQRQIVLRRAKFDLKEAEARCHILEGLIIGVHNIDEVIKIIRRAESTSVARTQLMERFELTERQAQAILDLRLARLAKLEIKKLEDELKELKKKILELKRVIGSKELQYEIVKKELIEIRDAFPCPRKTVIYNSIDEIPTKRADIRPQECACVAMVSANERIKLVEKNEYLTKSKRMSPRPDNIAQVATELSSEGVLLMFTNLGNVVRLQMDEQELSEFRSFGVPLKQLCGEVQANEKVVAMFGYKDEFFDGNVMFFTKCGIVKLTAWDEYKLERSYFPAIKLRTGDEVVSVEHYDLDEFSTMTYITKKGMCLNAERDKVPVQGRIAAGVQGMIVAEDDEVIFASQQNGEGELIVATSLSTFKRVIASSIDVLGRGRKGVMIADIKGKAEIIFASHVTKPYSLAVQTSEKQYVEISSQDIPVDSRVSKGKVIKGITDAVKVFSLKTRQIMPVTPSKNTQLHF